MYRILTIGREFGSGGRTIAKMTAAKLGIPVYDSELLVKIAEKSGFVQEYIEKNAENFTLGSMISRSLSRMGSYQQMTAEDYLWKIQREVIINLAQKESCVIVGRCADYILKGKADCLRVFIYASLEKRVERITSVYGDESSDAPEKRLRDKDKHRSSFYYYHTDMVWGNPHNYHICLDSGELGFEKSTEIICSLF